MHKASTYVLIHAHKRKLFFFFLDIRVRSWVELRMQVRKYAIKPQCMHDLNYDLYLLYVLQAYSSAIFLKLICSLWCSDKLFSLRFCQNQTCPEHLKIHIHLVHLLSMTEWFKHM